MITPEFAQTMAAYNRWQNRNIYTAADTLTDDARRWDRGAFFKSIHATLNHILWADTMWLSRMDGLAAPAVDLRHSGAMHEDWETLKQERAQRDEHITAWAARIDAAWLAGEVRWFSAVRQSDLIKPRSIIVTHFFNHQTHHRGQAHAMLTAAGAKTDATDLAFMPLESGLSPA